MRNRIGSFICKPIFKLISCQSSRSTDIVSHQKIMSTYRRVATADAAASPPNNDEAYMYGKRTRSERISDKIHAFVWVVVAVCTASYTHFFPTLFADDRIMRPIFNISMALFSINVILTFYLTIYLPCKFPRSSTFNVCASSPEFWGAYCPRVVPIMIFNSIIGSFLMVRACVGVWGFLTPLVIAVVAMGMFFSLHFIPWC